MISVVAFLALNGQTDVEVQSATMWSIQLEGERSTVHMFGLQESSQPRISRRAKIAAKNWLNDTKDLGVSFESMGSNHEGVESFVASHTNWTGDLAFREPNVFYYGPALLIEGLVKVNPREFKRLSKWVANEFALCEDWARRYGKGMWAMSSNNAATVLPHLDTSYLKYRL